MEVGGNSEFAILKKFKSSYGKKIEETKVKGNEARYRQKRFSHGVRKLCKPLAFEDLKIPRPPTDRTVSFIWGSHPEFF